MHRFSRLSLVAALVCALTLFACAPDEGSTEPGSEPGPAAGKSKSTEAPRLGKTDSALSIVEAGRFEGETGRVSGIVEGSVVQAYRFNAWGDTTIRVTLSSPGIQLDPYLAVDGPIPGVVGQVVAFNDDGPGDTLDSVLEVTLEEAGAYRLLVGSYEAFHEQVSATTGGFDLAFTCMQNCQMQQITLAQLLTGLKAEIGEEGVRQLISSGVASLFPDPTSAAAVAAQVEAVLASPGAVEEFPVLPMSLLSAVQGLFEAPDTAVPPPGPVHFDVAEILTEGCSARRAELKQVHPSVPGLMTGSVADYSLDDCGLQRAQAFADVLNNLALENGSSVTHMGKSYSTIEEVIRALIAAGHKIVVSNDRFFADFMGLSYKGKAVIASAWLDTGIPLPAGGTLALPSPHTHHTFVVSGPLVNAKIMYYMGVSGGVSFRAVANVRSPFTGLRTSYTVSSDKQAEDVVRVFTLAGKLRRRWADEARSRQLPAEGYGILGVCNDSTALLEYALKGTVTIFPLAHPPLDGDPADEIDQLLGALPSDALGFQPQEAIARIEATLPFENLDALPFPGFAAKLRSLLTAGQ